MRDVEGRVCCDVTQGTQATAGMRYDMILRLSVCPIMRPQSQCAAVLRLYTTSGAAALVTAQHSVAYASSVTVSK